MNPPVNNSLFEEFKEFVGKWLRENLTPLTPDTDVSFETWLEGTNYTESRKKELRQLNEKIIAGEEEFKQQHHVLKCFLKDESYPTFKNPRGIFARQDEFKCHVGRFFKAIEHILYHNDYFIKYIPVEDRPRYLKERFGLFAGNTGEPLSVLRRIVGTDYTAFEASFLVKMMQGIEFQLYEYMTGSLPEGLLFMKFLNKYLLGTNICEFRMFTAEVLSGRMSGEMNTSIGNGFTNLMVYLFAMHKFGCKEFDCIVEGDDCLGVYLGPIIPEQFYNDLGFTIKIKYYEECNTASFCGQIFDFDTFTVIADPLKLILNFGWASSRYKDGNAKTMRGLLRSKALSYFHQYPGAPIIHSFANAMVRMTHGFRYKIDKSLTHWEQKRALNYCTREIETRVVSYSSRLIMAEVFGFSIDEQINLESYFDSLDILAPLWHPIIDRHCSAEHELAYDLYVVKGGDSFTLNGFDCPGASLKLLECLKEIKRIGPNRKINLGKELVPSEKLCAIKTTLRVRSTQPHCALVPL